MSQWVKSYISVISNSTIICIPAYNEQETIENVVKELGSQFDICIGNDCSTDNTLKIIRKLNVKYINNKRNLGYEATLNNLYIYALEHDYKYMITMDADGQHCANDVKLVSELLKKNDLVLTTRPNYPRLGEKFFSFISKKILNVEDLLSGLKGYRLRKTENYKDNFDYIGSKLALEKILGQQKYVTLDITIKDRNDEPRYGAGVRVNMRLFLQSIRMIKYIINRKNKCK